MGMFWWFIKIGSCYHFVVIISQWILPSHSGIEPIHELLIFFSTMITCTIFPHHISDSGSFSYSEMFYVFVCFLISWFDLSDDGQDIRRIEVDDLHWLIILRNRRNGRNSNGHSCDEEGFKDGLPAVLAVVGLFLSVHRLAVCLSAVSLFVPMVERRRRMRNEALMRRDVCLPCAYLWAAAMHTCLHIPMQLNSTRFLRLERCYFPCPCTVSPWPSFAADWTVNADKRYPQPWPLPHARGTRKPEFIFGLLATKIGIYPQTSKYFGNNLHWEPFFRKNLLPLQRKKAAGVV